MTSYWTLKTQAHHDQYQTPQSNTLSWLHLRCMTQTDLLSVLFVSFVHWKKVNYQLVWLYELLVTLQQALIDQLQMLRLSSVPLLCVEWISHALLSCSLQHCAASPHNKDISLMTYNKFRICNCLNLHSTVIRWTPAVKHKMTGSSYKETPRLCRAVTSAWSSDDRNPDLRGQQEQ